MAHSHSNKPPTSSVASFLAGGLAGSIARTAVAPLDRIKILLQTKLLNERGDNISNTLSRIVRDQGVLKLWQGNFVHLLRVFPYSAIQFAMFDLFVGERPGPTRQLAAGAASAIVATTLTYPLDVIKLRMNVQNELSSIGQCVKAVLADAGPVGLFKGYLPSILAVAPFTATNFYLYNAINAKLSKDNHTSAPAVIQSLGSGAIAGLLAQTLCYPLDTVRRRMQLKGQVYSSMSVTASRIFFSEGIAGFYRGMLANGLKIVPANAIRFYIFDALKHKLNIKNDRKVSIGT